MPMPIATDTLRVAPTMLEAWRSDDKYDYAREFASSGFSVWGWLMQGLERLMSSIFGKHFYAEYSLWIWLGLTVVALAVIVVLIIRARPALFYGTRRDLPADDYGEDSIYGVDFASAIGEAFGRDDYRQVVRLQYLQTLKTLSDDGLIDWQPSKTPTQYTREIRTLSFRQMTHHFLRVRYGDFPADRTLALDMQRMQQQVALEAGTTKGGTA